MANTTEDVNKPKIKTKSKTKPKNPTPTGRKLFDGIGANIMKDEPPPRNASNTSINRKLQEAEERRLRLFAKKSAQISRNRARADQMIQRKEQREREYKELQKDKLEGKMIPVLTCECHPQCETLIEDFGEKLKLHMEELKIQEQKEKQEKKAALREKKKKAKELQEKNMERAARRVTETNAKNVADRKTEIRLYDTKRETEQKVKLARSQYNAHINRERQLMNRVDKVQHLSRRHDWRELLDDTNDVNQKI